MLSEFSVNFTVREEPTSNDHIQNALYIKQEVNANVFVRCCINVKCQTYVYLCGLEEEAFQSLIIDQLLNYQHSLKFTVNKQNVV